MKVVLFTALASAVALVPQSWVVEFPGLLVLTVSPRDIGINAHLIVKELALVVRDRMGQSRGGHQGKVGAQTNLLVSLAAHVGVAGVCAPVHGDEEEEVEQPRNRVDLSRPNLPQLHSQVRYPLDYKVH